MIPVGNPDHEVSSSSNHLEIQSSRRLVMNNRTKKHLSSTIESKPLKLIWNIGPHIVCIIDKNIVEKLKINEGNICEQSLTEEGNILLKIKRL
jgi:hypothetical protein